ncbi:MAG TPA: nickel-dependent lactate racemase, partial [Candidatus Atribacteria bacterium]|nr:nickel-dependent lactate racemase [Candidatus Atribacteria bacterium]
MHIELKYGKSSLPLIVKDSDLAGILMPNALTAHTTGIDELRRAMENPIGTGRLKTIVKPGEKVAIITSDITRPVPSNIMLPVVLEELEEAGVSRDDITVVFALGSHRKHTEAEKRHLAGDRVYETCRCIDSDPSDCVYAGTTSFGTPVDVFRPVYEANRRICLGNIEYHYFAGYSGGAKALMPGVSSLRAIQANHSKMLMEGARTGELSANPIRLDIEEAAGLVPIDFILNVVLDENKQIVKAVAGHHIKAHRAGCDFLDSFYKVKIKERADIVVASAGGYPKDINLYQAQKALDNAAHAVKPGGAIILVASCSEGYGSEVFKRWIESAVAPEDLTEGIRKRFELGGHKAAAIAKVKAMCDIYLVSDMPEDMARKAFMKPYSSLQKAY